MYLGRASQIWVLMFKLKLRYIRDYLYLFLSFTRSPVFEEKLNKIELRENTSLAPNNAFDITHSKIS